jgi:hypothetical protein
MPTPLDRRAPHFRARITIFTPEAGGPRQGFFGFPDSGIRAVPVEMVGVPNVNTVGIYYEPDASIRGGESFEADCGTIWPQGFAPVLAPGCQFHIWDGRNIAVGEVLSVYHEHFPTSRNA